MTHPAVFNAAAIGSLLALERGDTTLTYTASANINRCCRCTEPKSSGRWRAEFFLWGDASIANAVSVGIVKASHPLTAYVGGHADGYGYRVAEGQIHNAGSSIASVTAGAKQQIIEVAVDFTDSSNPVATWKLDGVLLHSQTLPDAGPWMLAGTVSGSTGYDLFLMISSGQRGVAEYDSPVPFWTGVRMAGGSVRIAERACISGAADSPAHARFRGLLPQQSSLSLRRSVRAWTMREPGSGGLSGGSGTLRVVNSDRSLDALVSGDMAGARVRLLHVPEPVDGVVDMSAATPVDVLSLDSATAQGDAIIELALADPIQELANTMRRRLAPPYADDSAADRPLPVSIGSVRSVLAQLLDEPSLRYAIHDRGITGLGTVRDGGYPYDPLSIPPPYALTARGEIVLDGAAPHYVLTADLYAAGDEYIPPSPTDALGGDGNPFHGTVDDVPDDWTPHVSASPASDDVRLAAGGKLEIRQDVLITSWMEHPVAVLEAGKTYKYRIRLERLMGRTPSYSAQLSFSYSQSFSNEFARFTGTANGTMGFHDQANDLSLPRTFESYISPTTNSEVWIGYRGNNLSEPTPGFFLVGARIAFIEIIEIPTTEWTEDDDAVPMPLAPALSELLERNAQLSPDDWERADAEALDTLTGYAGIGIHAAGGEDVTLEAAIRAALDPYLADVYRDRTGKLRIWTLEPPEDKTATFTLTRFKLRGEPQIRRHRAPGLSTRGNCRKNWYPLTGNMSTDTIDLTPDIKAKLRAEYRIGVVSGQSLAPYYARAAAGVPPKGFALDKRFDAQRALDRACRYYSVDRYEFEAEVAFDLAHEIGRIAWVDYLDGDGQRPVLPGPRNMEILDIYDEDPIAGTVKLLLVG